MNFAALEISPIASPKKQLTFIPLLVNTFKAYELNIRVHSRFELKIPHSTKGAVLNTYQQFSATYFFPN